MTPIDHAFEFGKKRERERERERGRERERERERERKRERGDTLKGSIAIYYTSLTVPFKQVYRKSNE